MQQCVHLVDIETMLLQNEYLLANVGSDTAENESSKVIFLDFLIPKVLMYKHGMFRSLLAGLARVKKQRGATHS